MSTEIRLQVETLYEQLNVLQKSLQCLQQYDKDYIQTAIENLETMNSDFVTEMEKRLYGMKDTDAPEVLKEAKQLHEATNNMVKTFEEKDTSVASLFSNKEETPEPEHSISAPSEE